jgi:hypothetical protein
MTSAFTLFLSKKAMRYQLNEKKRGFPNFLRWYAMSISFPMFKARLNALSYIAIRKADAEMMSGGDLRGSKERWTL